MKNIVIVSVVLLITALIYFGFFKVQESINNDFYVKHPSVTEVKEELLIQDSLINYFDSIKSIVYFGYRQNRFDKTKWDDILEIYHIKNNDTILNNNFKFFRQPLEGKWFLAKESIIPTIKIQNPSFILGTSISNKGNFSENIFTYNPEENNYTFTKRVNYMDGNNKDTLGLKTTFNIKNIFTVDSTEMQSIFEDENSIFFGKVLENSEWIIESELN